jgi:hypothetical protein
MLLSVARTGFVCVGAFVLVVTIGSESACFQLGFAQVFRSTPSLIDPYVGVGARWNSFLV